MRQCQFDLELKTNHLVEIMETGYADFENWSKFPSEVFLEGIRKTCFANINRARQDRGEAPLGE